MPKTQWFIQHAGKEFGPLDELELKAGLLTRRWNGGLVRTAKGPWLAAESVRRKFLHLVEQGWYLRHGLRQYGPFTASMAQQIASRLKPESTQIRLSWNGNWQPYDPEQPLSDPLPPPKPPLRRSILTQPTCPHCWHSFPSAQIRWIARHSELRGDAKLGPDALRRFLPTRFSESGDAIDARGQVCQELACPRCHLELPRPLLELPSTFLSVLGAPGSGKSYFLTAAIHFLRATMQNLGIRWLDASASLNLVLHQYLNTLFMNADQAKLVALPKTEMEGELYQSIRLDGRDVWFPRPFLFTAIPEQTLPRSASPSQPQGCIVNLYDNAGEHFLPGRQNVDSFATHHLEKSGALIFLYDPTQHAPLRQRLSQTTSDPQISQVRYESVQQTSVLQEAVDRVRGHRGLHFTEPIQTPIIIAVTKFDLCQSLWPEIQLAKTPYLAPSDDPPQFQPDALRPVSDQIRTRLREIDPHLITVAEGASHDVLYLPVSSQGTSPSFDDQSQQLRVRPMDLKPIWPEVALLYALFRIAPSLFENPRPQTSRITA